MHCLLSPCFLTHTRTKLVPGLKPVSKYRYLGLSLMNFFLLQLLWFLLTWWYGIWEKRDTWFLHPETQYRRQSWPFQRKKYSCSSPCHQPSTFPSDLPDYPQTTSRHVLPCYWGTVTPHVSLLYIYNYTLYCWLVAETCGNRQKSMSQFRSSARKAESCLGVVGRKEASNGWEK